MIQLFTRHFAKGLFILVPLGITFYTGYAIFQLLDGWLKIGVPGVGLLLTVVLITSVGFLSSSRVGARFFTHLEDVFIKVPFVKILYGSLKDLTGAFAGKKKNFDQPVIVTLDEQSNLLALGFVTCSSFDDAKLQGYVSVYFPQSYNFAGNLLLVPKSKVERIDADGAQFMAFILSGGVARMEGARTLLDASGSFAEQLKGGPNQR